MNKDKSSIIVVLLALCVGAALAFGYMKVMSYEPWSRSMEQVRSAALEEIMVMRTKGGLLEVSRIRATEVFDTTFVRSVLGLEVARTMARIRVPAVYRYHIELAPEWRVLRSGDAFTVVAPAVKASLPVAVDLARMEKEASGVWSVFTGTEDLNDLERSITAKLGTKAVMPAYVKLQREDARQTVAEFVRKWLVTQTPWQGASRSDIRVYFADEPIGSFGPTALPQLAPGLKPSGVARPVPAD